MGVSLWAWSTVFAVQGDRNAKLQSLVRMSKRPGASPTPVSLAKRRKAQQAPKEKANLETQCVEASLFVSCFQLLITVSSCKQS